MNDYSESFAFLLKGDHEVVIYGVLKRLNITKNDDQYYDLVQEGRLAFLKSYYQYEETKYQNDLDNDKKRLNYIYQGVYWHLLDMIKKDIRYNDHLKLVSKEDDNPIDQILDDINVENDVFHNQTLQDMYRLANEKEKELLIGLYYYGMNNTDLAAYLGISRISVYKRKKRFIQKFRNKVNI